MPVDGNVQTNHVQATRLLAAGFNGHHQLFDFDHDAKSFKLMLEADGSIPRSVLFAGWSTTVFQAGSKIYSLGYQQVAPIDLGDGVVMTCAFGDHEGMAGCIDQEGRLYLLDEQRDPAQGYVLSCQSTDTSPKIGKIALAGNGRIALTFKQAPNGNLAHVAEFASLGAFRSWFEDPSGEDNYPECHHMLAGRPKQLLANTGTFILLMESGDVHTWGDARYQSLGRSISGDDCPPADKPGAVDALGGLQISRVASGGWINAALSEDGALYVWGASTPGAEGSIRCLGDEDSGEVALVTLPDSDSEPLDILDVGVGTNHIAAVVDGGRLFVVGENFNGQLGLDSEEDFQEDWQEVPSLAGARNVWCGARSSFLSINPS